MADRSPPAARRTNNPAGVRGRLMDAAADLFQSRGYHATTMGDIMQAAGVTGGAMYHHYPTKKALGAAVIRERVRQAVEETWIDPVRTAASTRKGVALVLKAIHDDLAARARVQGCPLNNLALELSLADAELRAEVEAVFSAWKTALAEKIGEDQARGALPAGDPLALAIFVIAAYSGAMAMAKAEQHPGPIGICAQQLDQIMRG